MAKQHGRVIKCKNCGESGVRAGGIHKEGDHYVCNNSDTCKAVARGKANIMSQRKEVKQL